MSEELWKRAKQMQDNGQSEGAIAMVRLHLKIRPKDFNALSLLGSLLQMSGQLDQALHFQSLAMNAVPKENAFRHNYANTLLLANRTKEAVAQWEITVKNDPQFAMGWGMLAANYRKVGDPEKSIEAAKRTLRLNPNFPGIEGSYAFALADVGQLVEASQVLQSVVHKNPAEHQANSSLLMLSNYLPQSSQAVFALHQSYGRIFNAATPPQVPDRDPARALRIGILSNDLRYHSVSFYVRAFMRHKPEGAHIIVFSTAPAQGGEGKQAVTFQNAQTTKADDTTSQLRALADTWLDVGNCDHPMLNAIIREQRIDVLLELAGHTWDNRLPAIALKPAPVIVTAIGYPNTTGVPAVDWRLVDSITDPISSESYCTERLVRLDPCFLCYSPPAHAPEPTLPDASAAITFGSFNNAQKISSETCALWARVMAAVPGSRLLLKSEGTSNAAARANLLQALTNAGIAQTQIEMVGWFDDRDAHLRLYNRIHIALDTMPYNGTTTTCEAMWMGLPVVCMRGDRHAARVSASLVSAAGHPEWIAENAEQYAQIAIQLATDHATLTSTRHNLRQQLIASPLLDEKNYAQRFHAALRACWADWCAAHV